MKWNLPDCRDGPYCVRASGCDRIPSLATHGTGAHSVRDGALLCPRRSGLIKDLRRDVQVAIGASPTGAKIKAEVTWSSWIPGQPPCHPSMMSP